MVDYLAKVRKLPLKSQCMIEAKNIPDKVALYNPSKAGQWIYIRKTLFTDDKCQLNNMLMYNEDTKIMNNIDSPLHLLQKTLSIYKGLEDLRICLFEGRLWFSACCAHASENMNSEIVIGYFNESVSEIEKLQMLCFGRSPVKNVMPFVHNNRLCFIDVFAREIYELHTDETTGKWSPKILITLIPACGVPSEHIFRGSSSPIHLHGSLYGCVVHNDIARDNSHMLISRLSYLHYWYEFDINTGLVTFISTPFWLIHWGVEYVSGIYKNSNGTIELFLGVDDRLPFKALTTLSNLRVGK